MKKIALLTDGWHRFMTSDWAMGIEEYLKSAGLAADTEEGISLFQYQCWGNWNHNERHNMGEYNIFNLPELTAFDGIILDSTNIKDRQIREWIRRLVVDSGVPAVSLCQEMEGIYYAGIDGRSAVLEIMEHLYEVHECRSYAFVCGPEDNYEGAVRRKTYEAYLAQHHIPKDRAKVIAGGFDSTAGERACRQLLSEGKMPEAVVCVNDNVAIGLIAEAEKLGLRVPEDFLVTGFDRLDKADYFLPQITSGLLDRRAIAAMAVKVLQRIWRGEATPRHTFTPTSVICTESCGCKNPGTVRYRHYMKNQILQGIDEDRREYNTAAFEAKLYEAEAFEQMPDMIVSFYRSLGCDECFLVLDERVVSADPDVQLPNIGYEYPCLNKIYGFMKDHHAYEKCGGHLPENMKELRTYLYERQERSFVFFTPLHFGPRTAGLIVTVNPRYIAEYIDLYKVNEIIQNTLKFSFQARQLENALYDLRKIYNRDQLTGVYARTAYDKVLLPLYQHYQEEGRGPAVLFIDVDHFKKTNDTYGHEHGDRILIQLAQALRDQVAERGCVCRYGGDEFVVLLPYDRREEIDQFCGDLRSRLKREHIEISLGYAAAGAGQTLEMSIAAADRKMYAEKASHRS